MPETDTALIERERERLHAALTAHGYRDIPEHRGIKPGARVRHIGQWADYHCVVIKTCREDA
jgi:hypothetical protein